MDLIIPPFSEAGIALLSSRSTHFGFGLVLSNSGSILNIGVEEKKVEHKSPKSCRIESSNLIFTGGVYALQGLYNKNTGYGTHEG